MIGLVCRSVLLAAGLVALLWFLRQIADVLVLSLFAVVLAIVLNAPVAWLERHRVRRWVGALLVFGGVAGLVVALGWLVLPRLVREAAALVDHLPEYGGQLRDWADSILGPYPEVRDNLPLKPDEAGEVIPAFPELVRGVTKFSVGLATAATAVLILLAMVVYAVVRPRPLLRLYLDLFPPSQRERAARAFSRVSVMLVGWLWSNAVVGAIEAVLVAIVLGLLQVPAVLVWAALAFFAELVPKVGIYLMAIPPVLVALAVDPMTALWVALFYTAMSELMGDFVTPRVRGKAMDLHPVSVLFVMLAMAAAFGVLGALIATPITAFIKAYFEEFYPPARRPTAEGDDLVELMVRREAPTGSPDRPGSHA